MNLNLGCGRTRVEGFVNVDVMPGPNVDMVADLDNCPELGAEHGLWLPEGSLKAGRAFLPWQDNEITESIGTHVIEHLHRPLEFMQDLWRITRPGGICEFAVPYGSSDDAWEDPTHVRPYFIGSWLAFTAPYYWRADYGYRADWQPTRLVLDLDEAWRAAPQAEIQRAIMVERNVVMQMTCELTARKPAREADRHLLEPAPIEFRFVD